MEKRHQSVTLSFVLLRFAIGMLGCLFLCCAIWLAAAQILESTGAVYSGYVSNQQVEKLLAAAPETFSFPGENFLAQFALFDEKGEALESNVKGRKLEELKKYFREETDDVHVSRYTYLDGSTLIMRWYYRKEFVNPVLRSALPAFEILWWVTLLGACVLCVLLNILRLRRRLAAKLKLFGEVSEKIGARELDFVIPRAGIREYDRALEAMEHMREALYGSLSAQWAAKQEREEEIAALAHDLKTPLTLVGGNAELLLKEELPENSRKMVETILRSNNRAKQYMTSLLEASVVADEAFESVSLPALFEELCSSASSLAEAEQIVLEIKNGLMGDASVQKDRLLRAIGNVVQNAIEHTPAGGRVYLEGSMTEGGWQITVRDEGPGFSQAALHHATERLWRGNAARGADGHNGLGLWFAAQVVKSHGGEIKLHNCHTGGAVTVIFRLFPLSR